MPCPPDMKRRLIGKAPDAGEEWRRKEKRAAEDEVVGWHHRPSGHDLGKLGDSEGQGEAWRAAVHGAQRLGHDLGTEQQIFIVPVCDDSITVRIEKFDSLFFHTSLTEVGKEHGSHRMLQSI